MKFNLKAAVVSFLAVVVALPALAQTAPCGRSVLRTGGDRAEDRFISAPFEQVKSSLIKALPAVDARLKKDNGSHIEAAIDGDLMEANQKGFGSEGMKVRSSGTFHIDLAPETRDGVAGTRLQIRFSKGFAGAAGSGKYATPLADETVCLLTLLSASDPSANPRGPAPVSAQSNPHSVILKADTPVKVALLNYFYTKEIPKNTPEVDITLEVVEDVIADGVVVIRKGALAKGKVSDLSKSKSYGRQASFNFVVESATAVDGQEVALNNAAVVRKGTSGGAVAAGLVGTGPILGAFMKGKESLARAGTTWELPTAKDITIVASQ
ncbi:MAG: hypothetical protein ABSC47_01865 [Terracidiphilus sp.]